ncbi:MAG: NAD(P)H-binding protein [Nitrospiraceae bacterium]|nr:NAD(P)H-binding protein [Nitrospiraceae bacterium]
MKTVIFGASGRTGRRLVRQALDRGHAVTAFVRNPSKMDISHENLSLFEGDVLHSEEVDASVTGHETALSAAALRRANTPEKWQHAWHAAFTASRNLTPPTIFFQWGFEIRPIKDRKGETTGIVLVFRDITASRECRFEVDSGRGF